MSGICLRRLADANLLERREIEWSRLQEAHRFGLFVRAVGLRSGDLSTDDGPFAVRWKGLPAHPRALLESGKKIVHSTKYYEDMTEGDIRSIFRKARHAAATG